VDADRRPGAAVRRSSRLEGPLLERLKVTPVQITEVDLGGGIDSPSGLLRIVKLARFLRRQRFQILHAHDLWSNIVGMAAAMLALGGNLEIMQDGTTGLLVPPQDSQALAAA